MASEGTVQVQQSATGDRLIANEVKINDQGQAVYHQIISEQKFDEMLMLMRIMAANEPLPVAGRVPVYCQVDPAQAFAVSVSNTTLSVSAANTPGDPFLLTANPAIQAFYNAFQFTS